MIKDLKAWFTKDKEKSSTTLNVSVDFINAKLQYHVIDDLRQEIVEKIAQHFLEENGEKIKKEIVNNPRFADALYNAILLKEVDRIRK